MPADTQWLVAHNLGINNGVAQYFSLSDAWSGLGNVNEFYHEMRMPAAGTFTRMYVRLSAAPGVGKSWRFQFRKFPTTSTVLDVTITGAATTGTASGVGVAVAVADYVGWLVTPAGAPAAATAEVWLEWTPTTPSEFIYYAGSGVNLYGAGVPQYWNALAGCADGNGIFATGGVSGRGICPFAATITAFSVSIEVSPGAGRSRSFRITINGVEQAASDIVLAGAGGTNNQATITGLSIAVAAGDSIGFKEYAANAPANARGMTLALAMIPLQKGNYVVSGSTDAGNQSNSLVRYYDLHQQNNSDWNNADGGGIVIPPFTFKLRGFAMEITTAPGAGKSHTVQGRTSAANSGQSLAFDDAVTLKKISSGGTLKLVGGEALTIQNTPAGTPANMGVANWSWWFGSVNTLRQRTLRGAGV